MGVSVSYRTQPSSVDTTRPTKDGSTHALSDPVVIRISQGGFVPSTLTVFSRQKVSWQWEGDENTEGHNVVQVSATDQRYHFPPVPGGFSSGPLSHSDTFDVSLRAPGTYYFTSYGFASYKVGTVHVKDIPPRTVKVSDGSFHPSLVEISEGEAVRWEWDSIPNDVKQMRYCPKHGGLIVEKSNFDLDDTPSYTTTQEFKSSGLHYCFSNNTTEPCVVRVQQSDREINIRFAGDGGGPPVVHASVGDRIWVKNDQPKKNSRKMYIKNEEGIIVVSTKPIDLVSRRHSSLLSHCVTLPGVYQVCCEDECGSILQTCVLVQPRTKEHVINIDSQGFKPELGCIQKGDRVWWMWSGEEDVPGGFTVQQESFVTTSQRPSSEEEDDCCVRSEELCQAISPVGLITAKQDSEGLVTYYLKPTGPWQPQGAAMCSLIVQNTAQEHLVCISDQNFKPQIISVHPGDSVTWLWENTVNSHNIQQASHQRTIIPDGFHGDRPIPSPGAFRHVFTDLGLFYFTSSALPSLCGAVVVTAQPQIHKVEVSLFGVEPDPVIVKAGDCVCWMWCSGELYDIRAIVSPEEIGQVSKDQYIPEPRRCFAKHFSGTGAHHVACTAFTRDEDEVFGHFGSHLRY